MFPFGGNFNAISNPGTINNYKQHVRMPPVLWHLHRRSLQATRISEARKTDAWLFMRSMWAEDRGHITPIILVTRCYPAVHGGRAAGTMMCAAPLNEWGRSNIGPPATHPDHPCTRLIGLAEKGTTKLPSGLKRPKRAPYCRRMNPTCAEVI